MSSSSLFCNSCCNAFQSYGVSLDNIFTVESSACPSLDEIKELPNKVLLWCGMKQGSFVNFSFHTIFSDFCVVVK